MYKNLGAEQKRFGLSDEECAKRIGLSPSVFIAKKMDGSFLMPEVRALLNLFLVSFDYLFETDKDPKKT